MLAIALLGLVAGSYMLVQAARDLRFKRLAGGLKTSKIGDLAEGLVALRGRTRPLEPMMDPIYGKPCSSCLITVTQSSLGEKAVPVKLADTSRQQFWLIDETGRVLVDPKGARTLYQETFDVEAGQYPKNHPVEQYIRGIPGIGPEGWRLHGEIVRPEIPLHVLGWATPIDAPPTGRAMRTLDIPLREWSRLLKSDPDRMRAVDADKDGVVDPLEWEEGLKRLREQIAAQEAAGQGAAGAEPIAPVVIRQAAGGLLFLSDESDPALLDRGKGIPSAENLSIRLLSALLALALSLRIVSTRLGKPPAEAGTARGPAAQEASLEQEPMLHLTSPQDTAGILAGQDEKGDQLPTFQSPVRFTWEPLGPEVKYFWLVELPQDGGGSKTFLKDLTPNHDMELSLPPTPPGQRYKFRLEALQAGRRVGVLNTRGRRRRRGHYSFRVGK